MAKKKKATKKQARKVSAKPRRAPTRKAARKATRKAAPRARVAKAAKRRATPARAKAKARAVKAPKKAVKAAPAARKAKPAPRAKAAVRRQDRAGHLDPHYAAELRSRTGRPAKGPESFLDRPRTKDDLVEELGEEFVESATSGEYEAEDKQNQAVSEEVGGPFVRSTAGQEFADGTDASNPKGSTREPFPTT